MCSSIPTPSMNKKRRPKARKSRAKVKKPKFLSFRLRCWVEEAVKARRIGRTRAAGASVELVTTSPVADSKSHGLNLFPLHPTPKVKYFKTERSVPKIKNTSPTSSPPHTAAPPSLAFSMTIPPIPVHLILRHKQQQYQVMAGLTESSNVRTDKVSDFLIFGFRQDNLSPSLASLTYTYGGHDSRDGSALVRNAMKNRERDSSEEKWVCYSEVVERKKMEEEEVTSSAVDPRLSDDQAVIQGLALKLDYQEILKAWSNKGPLYVDAENSQIVPDMSDGFLLQESSSYNVMGLWKGQRGASLLRYKEKRRNRLYSKKIRYQVRKLNADKRPRLKGRFVKRS